VNVPLSYSLGRHRKIVIEPKLVATNLGSERQCDVCVKPFDNMASVSSGELSRRLAYYK